MICEILVNGQAVTVEKTTASYRAPGQGKTFKMAQWIATDTSGRILADGCATKRDAIANATMAIEAAK